MHTCKICNKEIESVYVFCEHIKSQHKITVQTYYDTYIKTLSEGICQTCNKPTKFKNVIQGYKKFCSSACVSRNPDLKKVRGEKISKKYNSTISKRKETCLNKYGVESPMQSDIIKNKLKESMSQKYGVDHYSKTPEYVEKMKKICLEKYGKDWYSKTDEYKTKTNNTNTEKYGAEYYSQTDECKQKVKDTCNTRYGVSNYSQTPEYKEKYKNTCLQKYNFTNPSKDPNIIKQISMSIKESFYNNVLCKLPYIPQFTINEYNGHKYAYSWKCKNCNTVFTSRFTNRYILHCPNCEAVKTSTIQDLITKFILSYKFDIKGNYRKLLDNKFEVDVYIPEKSIGIEINGNYWHSEIIGEKTQTYHIHKTKLCESKNIKLIQIFEDEIIYKEKIVKARLKSILGLIKRKIYARNCEIKEIDIKSKNKFLNKYHIQGEDKSNVHLGCFYKNRLISVMTFSKMRIALGNTQKQDTWELVRYCTINNFVCVGVASKLLSYFIKQYCPIKIVSYADRRWSQGNMYYKLGFTLDHISKPNYWYLSNKNFLARLHRFGFRKHILKDILPTFDPKLSEWKNMQNNGYDRIWDCGNYVFVWNSPHSTKK